jgi:hypothetical protein
MLGRYAWPLDLFSRTSACSTRCCSWFWAIVCSHCDHRCSARAADPALSSRDSDRQLHGRADRARRRGIAEFRVVTFNTWFRNHDYAAIGRFLEQMQADVIVLEERDRRGAQRLARYLTSYPHSFIEPRPHGVVIFARGRSPRLNRCR